MNARNAIIVLSAFLVGACVRLGHIQQTVPIRTIYFSGSHKTVAQCVLQRLGGQLQVDTLQEQLIIYDSAKGRQTEGLTHYSITIGKAPADRGFAEMRVVRPARGPGPSTTPVPVLTDAVIRTYWDPVLDCIAQAKGS